MSTDFTMTDSVPTNCRGNAMQSCQCQSEYDKDWLIACTCPDANGNSVTSDLDLSKFLRGRRAFQYMP
jgi:hypothetical protein